MSLSKECEMSQNKNPMDVDVIIQHIFQYLKFYDLTACKLVCRRWRLNSHQILTKLATCVIRCPQCMCKKKKTVDVPEMMEFQPTNFTLRNRYNCYCLWTSDSFSYIFEKYQLQMRELTIESIRFDIQDSLMLKNLPKLTKLFIQQALSFIIPLEELDHVKELELGTGITIDARKSSIKISPIKLKLKDVKFLSAGIKTIVLNDMFNFTDTKWLQLHYKSNWPTLDMSDISTLDFFQSKGVSITYATKIEWKFIELKMDISENRPLNLKNVSIKKMKTKITQPSLKFLPQNVEVLDVEVQISSEGWSNFKQINFPNLKTLILNCLDHSAFKDTFGKSCPLLETVTLKWHRVFLNCFLPSVKTLCLVDNVDVIADGSQLIKIDNLVLYLYDLENASTILQFFDAETTVIYLQQNLFKKSDFDLSARGAMVYGPIHETDGNQFYKVEKGMTTKVGWSDYEKLLILV